MSCNTVKQVNFAGNLISRKAQIREIKLPQNCKFYIDSNGKFSIFAKLSARKNSNNFQFAKLSSCKINLFYSIWNSDTVVLTG